MPDYTAALDAAIAALEAKDVAVTTQLNDHETRLSAVIAANAALTTRVAALEGPPPDPVLPGVKFTITPTEGVTPLHVDVTVTATNADHWQMNWGGGLPTPIGTVHPATDTVLSHDYPAAGSYSLSLRAWRDSDGKEATATALVTVTSPPPPPPTGGRLGVRFGGIADPIGAYQNLATNTKLANAMAAAGFGWYRSDLTVAAVSPTQGTFNWSGVQNWVNPMRAADIECLANLYILPSWMNGSTDDKMKPTSPGIYASWCADACEHLWSMGVHAVELWNEQNLNGFWHPFPNRVDYVAMAIAAADAIHARVPQMIVVSGGVSTDDSQTSTTEAGYTTTENGCYRTLDLYGKLGLYQHVDGVGLHPYLDTYRPDPGGANPTWCEWTGGSIRRAIAIVDRWAPGKNLKIWNTESAAPRSVMSEAEQATRAQLAFQAFSTWTLADGSPMRSRLGPYFYFTYSDWVSAGEPRARTMGLVDQNYVDHQARPLVTATLMTSLPS
jgi:PKD repeat protein